VYKSEKLSRELELKNLYICFSGYWPEKGCYIKTCTFKELEAPASIQRAIDCNVKSLVIASAGNTAKSFAYVSTLANFPVVLVVPRFCLPLKIVSKPDNVRLIAVNGDYSDAIMYAKKLCIDKNLTDEGGVKNVARRDGLGIVILCSVLKIGRIPDHYFQAIGSGTGAIGVYETILRLVRDGRFGKSIPKFHLSQNIPFTPMVTAWKNKHRIITETDMPNPKNNVQKIYAKVLSNRNPPYSIKGGVFDVLNSTDGETYAVSNNDARDAEKLFESTEEIDIVPAASIGVASLIQAVNKNKVGENDVILLNVTGGGESRLKEDYEFYEIEVHDEV
jgi:cysteate synthase